MSIQPQNVQGNQNVSQVNTSATQETNQVQNPVPAQLGESHSIGKTLSRCFASIQTAFANFGTCISNLFSSKAEVAPARPNLPQNFDKMTFSELKKYNKELSEKIKNNDNTIMPLIDKAFKEVSLTFSDFGSIDKGAFLERLSLSLGLSSDKMDDTNLIAFTKKTAGQHFATNIAKDFIEQHPEAHKVLTVTKNGFAAGFSNNKILQTIAEAKDPKEIGTLLPTLKEQLHCRIQSSVDSAFVQKELCELGQNMFSKQTGLGPEVKVKTWDIVNRMNIMQGGIDKPFATADKPYLMADKAALKAGWQGKVEEFYADRATAYNSISTLGLPESIATDWKKLCVTTQDKITPQMFGQVNTISNEVLKSGKIQVLTNPLASTEDKIKSLKDLAGLIHQKIEDVIGNDQMKQKGLDEKALIESLVLQVLLHPEKSDIVAFAKANADTFTAISEQMDNDLAVMRASVDLSTNPDHIPLSKAFTLLTNINGLLGI